MWLCVCQIWACTLSGSSMSPQKCHLQLGMVPIQEVSVIIHAHVWTKLLNYTLDRQAWSDEAFQICTNISQLNVFSREIWFCTLVRILVNSEVAVPGKTDHIHKLLSVPNLYLFLEKCASTSIFFFLLVSDKPSAQIAVSYTRPGNIVGFSSFYVLVNWIAKSYL